MSLALNVFKLQMKKKKKKRKDYSNKETNRKLFERYRFLSIPFRMDPLTAKKARKKGKKEEQFFEAPDVAGILLLSQPGREPGRVGYEKQRERENSSFVSSTFSENIQPIFPDTTVSYTANKSWLNSYDSVVSNYDRHIGNRWMIFL